MAPQDGFFVVDVGHGSCAALVQGERAVLFDVGLGAGVLQFLSSAGVRLVESIVVSHADADHIGGLIAILAAREVEVRNIYLNADASKTSERWRDLAYELDDLASAGKFATVVGVAKGTFVSCPFEGWTVEILAPRQRLVQLGVGNVDRDGRRITSNSMSVVARVVFDGDPLALITGDVDFAGYQHLAQDDCSLESRVLVLPHHGGSGGTRPQTIELNSALVQASGARDVVVSHGRKRHRNPLPIVVDAVHAARHDVRFRCTQMSSHCMGGDARLGLPKVSQWFSAGEEEGICCAGTMQWTPAGGFLNDDLHVQLVRREAADRLCVVFDVSP